MKNLSYSKKSTTKFSVKGEVRPDDTIKYVDDNGDDIYVDIHDVLKMFVKETIVLSISKNDDEDLLQDGNLPEVEEIDELDEEF